MANSTVNRVHISRSPFVSRFIDGGLGSESATRTSLKEIRFLAAYWSKPWTRRLLEAGVNVDQRPRKSPSKATKFSS